MKAYKTLTALFLLGTISSTQGKQSAPALAQQQAFLQDNEIIIDLDLADYKANLATGDTLSEIILDLNIENMVFENTNTCCSEENTCQPAEENHNNNIVPPPVPRSQVP